MLYATLFAGIRMDAFHLQEKVTLCRRCTAHTTNKIRVEASQVSASVHFSMLLVLAGSISSKPALGKISYSLA